jgi:hypothetical protein
MDLQNEFYSVNEMAKLFHCHPNTIRRAIHLGYFVAIRLGLGPKSPYRISRKSIEEIHTSIIRELAKKAKKE